MVVIGRTVLLAARPYDEAKSMRMYAPHLVIVITTANAETTNGVVRRGYMQDEVATGVLIDVLLPKLWIMQRDGGHLAYQERGLCAGWHLHSSTDDSIGVVLCHNTTSMDSNDWISKI